MFTDKGGPLRTQEAQQWFEPEMYINVALDSRV